VLEKCKALWSGTSRARAGFDSGERKPIGGFLFFVAASDAVCVEPR